MKNSINKNIIIAILIFFISGIALFLVQKNVYQGMENLTIKRTNDSINESLNEFSDSFNELASSYNKDLKGRVKTVALMLQNGYDDEILKKASDLCKANYLFIEDNDGMIIYAAQKEIKGKLAKDVLDEFIGELDNETEDYASAKIFDGKTGEWHFFV